MAWQIDFLVEATAGLVGVFAGVALALWTERRRNRAEQLRDETRTKKEFEEIRGTVLSSVLKNTVESRRVKTSLASADDPYLMRINLEGAVWEAAQAHFVRLAPLDDRVLIGRFFDHVRRLDRLLEFYREAVADRRLRPENPGKDDSLAIAASLGEVAEDVRLEGVVIITDHGTENQKRLLGLK